MTEEQRQKAIKLYKNKNLTWVEISNLVGVPVPTLALFWRDCMRQNIIEPRNKNRALQSRVPNGQGKKVVKKGVGSGNYFHRSKYTAEQELEIIQDYYERDMSIKHLKEKWNIFPKQLQRLRNKYREKYGIKPNAPYVYQNRYKNKEGNIENGKCADENGRTEVMPN